MSQRVLFVDDEEPLRHAASQTFELAGLDVDLFADAEAALSHIDRSFDAVLVTDIRMDGMDGVALLRAALEIDPEFPVILVTGHGDVDLAVACMKDGAYDFIEKPYTPARLTDAVKRALEKRRLTVENRALRRQVDDSDVVEARLVGHSPAMKALKDQVRAVGATQADVLVVGETGTGKEITARAIHRTSDRADKPFVRVDCAALPDALVESELFGHEAGAFPGAIRARAGRFEHARGGTVFLDEIDSLPLAIQAKLLHAVEERSVTRLGANEPLTLDVRIIASTKGGLDDKIERGEFRSDLYYRLAVVTLHIPTLDARREDIPRLFLRLVADAAAKHRIEAPKVSGDILSTVSARHWAGNVRQLRNAADRFVLGLGLDESGSANGNRKSLSERMADHEKGLIAAAIMANNGQLKSAYEALGLSRKSLYEKMVKYGLSREDFRETD